MSCLCLDEGFTFDSPYHDLSNCLISGIFLNVVSGFAIIAGLWQLATLRRLPNRTMRFHWSLFVKLGLVLLQFGFQIYQTSVQPHDIRLVAALANLVALAVAFSLHYVENFKTAVPSGVLLFYWLFNFIIGLLRCWNLSLRHDSTVVVASLLTANSLVIVLLQGLIPVPRTENEKFEKRSPYELASVFSKISFAWVTPLMTLGYHRYLVQSDLPKLPAYLLTQNLSASFDKAWGAQLARGKPSLPRALFRAFGPQYLLAGAFKIVQDILAYSQPQLLKGLIKFVALYNKDPTTPLTRGFIYVAALFASSVVQTSLLHQYFQFCFETGMKVKSVLISTIYQKSITMSIEEKQKKATGDVVNIMSVDTQRLQSLTEYLPVMITGPLQITWCLISLYNLMGNAMWVGVVIMVIMVPVNAWLFRLQKAQQRVQMKNKDERTRVTSEILNNIKSLKLYGWEKPYMEKLEYVRNEKELKTLKKIAVLRAFSQFIFNTAPQMVSCSTFLAFILLRPDVPLSTDIVFTALSLFNLLSFPLAMLPMVLSNVIESKVAVQRVTEFLCGEEIQNYVERAPAVTKPGEVAVRIEGGEFEWSKGKVALSNISYEARKGELNCLVGKVGAGKTAMISAMLGDLHRAQGRVSVCGSSAYVAQSPWVMNGTIKENILFGCTFDPVFYETTIRACALDPDLAILPDGDETLVGEKGISLSGGQKARVALARALYARADVYFFDDPLSAVDEHVGKHIIKNVLGPEGLLRSKCKILATNNLHVLTVADHITLVEDGKLVEAGTYGEILSGKLTQLSLLIKNFGRNAESVSMTPVSSESVSDVQSLRRGSLESFEGAAERHELKQLTNKFEETSQQGQVKGSIYLTYAKACRPKFVVVVILLILTMMSLTAAANVWLKHWSEINTGANANPHALRYLAIYFGLGVASAAASFVQSTIQWQLCSIAGSKYLHSLMLRSVLRAPMSFFETTPIGRILNRFTNDIYKIDETLAAVFGMFFTSTSRVLFTVIIIAYSTWQFLLLIIPMGFLYRYFQRYYVRASRELRRLDSVSKSPIYAHFQETLNGVTTIRAYGQNDRFKFLNRYNQDKNMSAYHSAVSANRWLAVRLEFLGSLVILSAAGLLMFSLPSGRISSGMVGLSISYALQVTQSLNTIVRMTVEIETNIVSVERIMEYAELAHEAPEVIEERRPPTHWPFEGSVKFENYSARYRPELDLVLKNINLEINSKEKIGIVGRTGAGKSSLTLALFRIIEAAEGDISIDSIVTSSIGLADLRHKLSIIPQDSQVFEGTIRENLDPTNQYTDEELWRALEHAHLKDHITKMAQEANEPDVLQVKLAEGGSNLSVGQKQLICLARALIVQSKVLVLDEATAAIDVETDKLLQETIRSEFKDRTILTIAHRINTIMDSDRVLVLERGQVAEFDTPENLLKNKESLFYSLAEQGGFV